MDIIDAFRITSIEAKDLFAAMNKVSGDNGYSLIMKDGRINYKKYTNTLSWSLDTQKLIETYEKKNNNSNFAFKYKRYYYTNNIINVTFKYSYKEFNLAGQNTYIRAGYTFRDCSFSDSVCIRDGRLVGIQTNVEFQSPVDQSLLEGYFKVVDNHYEIAGNFPVIMDRASLREYLYCNGFTCDGVEYVRYKRSSGSSRVGKCLFVNRELAEEMREWDRCGLTIKNGDQIDLAGYEAYISLPMSSIIDTLEIPLESILVIDDYESHFTDKMVAVTVENEHLHAEERETEVSNCIWDGQGLLDESMFGQYSDKGMLLLRNRFFKSCCFNTKLQKWFADNNITEVSQLNGYTRATDISQIKLITTPSSIKYLKYGSLDQWLDNVDTTFGVVKYEKPPHPFDGRMTQIHYQLINTLQLSYQEVEELLNDSLAYIAAIKEDPAVLRYDIKYPEEDEERVSAAKTKNEIIYKMLGVNDQFCKTKIYYDFRDDLIKSKIRSLKQGHVLVNGNYSTLFSNGLEMLKSAINTFDGESVVGRGNIHSTRFGYDQTILGTRSPHITMGNILLVNNVRCDDYEKYFNLSDQIVCINSIGDNILWRLNGADMDSDTMLITDNQLLISAAQKNYDKFYVPTGFVPAKKIKRTYSPEDQSDLDVKTSVNKIGEIVNCSQQLNSLLWKTLNQGGRFEDIKQLYYDICKLGVLSGIEIDKAKREYTINSGDEIEILKNKYKMTVNNKTIKPMFFKMITTENGYELSPNIEYQYFDTSMDYLQKIISKFSFRSGRDGKREVVPFMDLVAKPSMNYDQTYYYRKRDEIISAIMETRDDIRKLYIDYANKNKEERAKINSAAGILKQDCIDIIEDMSSNPAVMYLVLKKMDSSEMRGEFRFMYEYLFGKPNLSFFNMIKDSKDDIYILSEDEQGLIELFGFTFDKIKVTTVE